MGKMDTEKRNTCLYRLQNALVEKLYCDPVCYLLFVVTCLLFVSCFLMFVLCCLLFLALACIYLMPLPARGPHYSTKSLDKVYDVSGTASTFYHNRLIFHVPFIFRLWNCRGFRLHQFIWKISRAIDVGATNPLTLRMLSQYIEFVLFSKCCLANPVPYS